MQNEALATLIVGWFKPKPNLQSNWKRNLMKIHGLVLERECENQKKIYTAATPVGWFTAKCRKCQTYENVNDEY